MSPVAPLTTERLQLRAREMRDIDAIARMDGDAEVFRYAEVRAGAAPPPVRTARLRALRAEIEQETRVWAVERRGAFLGLVALAAEAPAILGFPRESETLFLSYRLARAGWGQGYATEAAAAVVAHAFDALSARALVAFCHAANARSRRVLEKLGMTAAGMLVARRPDAGDGQLYVCFRRERGASRRA